MVDVQPLLNERRLRTAVQRWAEESGARLRDRRKALDLKQHQLADLADVRNTAISKFELGLVIPKDATRAAIACALLCEVDDIWPPMPRRELMAVAAEVAA